MHINVERKTKKCKTGDKMYVLSYTLNTRIVLFLRNYWVGKRNSIPGRNVEEKYHIMLLCVFKFYIIMFIIHT